MANHDAIPSVAGLTMGHTGADVEALQRHLQQLGYLRLPAVKEDFIAVRSVIRAPTGAPGVFDDATLAALKSYQQMFALPETGVFDDVTIAQMRKPRCGFPDIPSPARIAEYVAQGNRWNTTNLTYGFAEFSPDLDQGLVRGAISSALALWANVTSLSFSEVPLAGNPDFVIRFVAGDHGDGAPFDGNNGILAHAFYPPPNGGAIAGDAHFDEDELWTVELPVPAGGIDLVTVAAHEFGHSLGLAHSTVAGALMYPYYGGANRALAQDDIDGIRSIYPWGWDPVYAVGDPGDGIGGYDLKSPADQVFTFDYDSSGKQDHLVLYRPGTGTVWILKNNGGVFSAVYQQGDPGGGIGGYDLLSPGDRMFAFDYDSNGKLDHLALYRPGTGTIWILKNSGGAFHAVYAQGDPGSGIGGYDLRSSADRVLAFDYDGSGKLDHLVLYRPGTGTLWILKNSGGHFHAVYAQGDPGNGIGGYDLLSPADRVIAFDYDGSGKQDHLVLYRPGTGTIWILKNSGGSFSAVYAEGDPGNGIGGYDLRYYRDTVFALDYDGSSRLDHLALYRPGTGTIWILKNVGGMFQAVYAQGDPGNGIGGYDLMSTADTAFAFDYSGNNTPNHIGLYRPGTGTIWLLKRET